MLTIGKGAGADITSRVCGQRVTLSCSIHTQYPVIHIRNALFYNTSINTQEAALHVQSWGPSQNPVSNM